MDGDWYDPELAACTKCYSWTYTPKGCASQDQANSLVDCHLYGANELDRRCFKKENIQGELPLLERKGMNHDEVVGTWNDIPSNEGP